MDVEEHGTWRGNGWTGEVYVIIKSTFTVETF